MDLAQAARMIEMQMGAQDGIDAFRRETRCRQVLEECRLEVAENIVLALAIRPDAGIDHHALATGAQHEGLEGNIGNIGESRMFAGCTGCS